MESKSDLRQAVPFLQLFGKALIILDALGESVRQDAFCFHCLQTGEGCYADKKKPQRPGGNC